MEEENKINDNEKVDVIGTMESIFKTEEKQLSQEEAIKSYTEEYNRKKKKNKANSDDESAYNEELEHLERIKKELLASLARVKKLEEKIFGEEKKEKIKVEKIKVDNKDGGVSVKKEKEELEKENKEMTRE